MKGVSFFTIPTKKINTIYLQPWTLLCFGITSIQSQERYSGSEEYCKFIASNIIQNALCDSDSDGDPILHSS